MSSRTRYTAARPTSHQIAISASSAARAVAYAIEQPADVDIKEIVLRPTAQDF
jgi:NADP-dependent 3-hydroxy acid dehydrogenase YdfG